MVQHEVQWEPCRGSPPFVLEEGQKELQARFRGPTAKPLTAFLIQGLLRESEVARLLQVARQCEAYGTGPDSVDGRPTFEVYVGVRGTFSHPELWACLEAAVRGRIEPWARERYGCPGAVVCTVLLRRYLGHERRSHPPHFDAHAFATCVVGLNPADFRGGLYVQPRPRAKRRFVALGVGDAVLHQYSLRHGVEVTRGERYSLIFWLKDCMASCIAGTTPWYEDAAASGDGDAAYNVANLLLHAGSHTQARAWFHAAAAVGQPDAAHNLGVMLAQGLGGPADAAEALRWWREAARRGKGNAARHLAMRSLEMDGMSENSEGWRWLSLAVDLGDAEAMLMLHHLPSTPPLARRSLRNAAARAGCAEAQRLIGEQCWENWLRLADSYFYGGSHECRVQWRRALKWLSRAANGGNHAAMLRLSAACCHPRAPIEELDEEVRKTKLELQHRSGEDGKTYAKDDHLAVAWRWLHRVLLACSGHQLSAGPSVAAAPVSVPSASLSLQVVLARPLEAHVQAEALGWQALHYLQGAAVPRALALPIPAQVVALSHFWEAASEPMPEGGPVLLRLWDDGDPLGELLGHPARRPCRRSLAGLTDVMSGAICDPARALSVWRNAGYDLSGHSLGDVAQDPLCGPLPARDLARARCRLDYTG
eukprot:CAMPEP_0203933900 /NCGR_PEP_ID=MMETSP0359-20131031/71987_1 /ASSEMBLY_ACC=CAM_ASM_000338 /TAXON_ID=268821 /ORGANISM="Scrippsiella Hangoei, Strain SHTV-5" /LENGTH=649 /DNA_ID=CAMNT_0050863541 /DNA_START=217 /DNA_END=2163 /DNA_ORIENTATION=-